MKSLIGLAATAALLALAGCGGSEAEQGAGGVTAEESQQLNEAAEMLDASPDSLAVTEGAELGNGEAGTDTGALPVSSNAATEAQQEPQ